MNETNKILDLTDDSGATVQRKAGPDGNHTLLFATSSGPEEKSAFIKISPKQWEILKTGAGKD